MISRCAFLPVFLVIFAFSFVSNTYAKDAKSECLSVLEKLKLNFVDPFKIDAKFTEKYGCWIEASSELDISSIEMSQRSEKARFLEAKSILSEINYADYSVNSILKKLILESVSLRDSGVIKTFTIDFINVEDDISNVIPERMTSYAEYNNIFKTFDTIELTDCTIPEGLDMELYKKDYFVSHLRDCEKSNIEGKKNEPSFESLIEDFKEKNPDSPTQNRPRQFGV